MATKVYLSGDKVVVDKTGEPPILNIPLSRIQYDFLAVTAHENEEVIDFKNVSLSDILTEEIRTDLVSEIQDSGGTPIGDFEAVKAYFEGFIDRGTATIVAQEQSGGGAIPDKVMEFEKDWNANTNSPTLLNTDLAVLGTVYRVATAGSTDFGGGSIAFSVDDWVYNDGTIWRKANVSSSVLVDFLEGAGLEVSLGSNNTWILTTLTGAPNNVVIEILINNEKDNKFIGVRSDGSLIDRKVKGKKGITTMTVKTNGSGQVELYAEDANKVTFQYWGQLV